MVRTAISEKANKVANAAKPTKPSTQATRCVMTKSKVLSFLRIIPNNKKFRKLREKLTKDVENFYQSNALPANMDDADKMSEAVCKGSFFEWQGDADYQRNIKQFYLMIQNSICHTFMLP